MISFAFALISIAIVFFYEILGLIFAIIVLGFGIVGMKKQEKWTQIGFVISIVSIIIFAGILFFDFVKIGKAEKQLDQIREEYNKDQA